MSTGDVVVDDHLLLRILLDDEPPTLRVRPGALSTTGLWYHRLCRALVNERVTGAMSRSLGDLDPDTVASVVRAVIELPEHIEVVSLRELGWPMAELLTQGARLNLLSLEALAAADHLDAELCLATADDNPALRAVASSRGVTLRTID